MASFGIDLDVFGYMDSENDWRESDTTAMRPFSNKRVSDWSLNVTDITMAPTNRAVEG